MLDLRPLACANLRVGPLSIALLCVGLGLAPSVHAQVELPGKPRAKVDTEAPASTAKSSTERAAGEGTGGAVQGGESTQRTTQPIVDFRTMRPVGTLTNEVVNGGTPDVVGFDPTTRRTPNRFQQQGGLDLPSGPRRPARPEQPASSPAPAAGGAGASEPASAAPTGVDGAPSADGTDAPRSTPFGAASLEGLRPAVRLVYETVAAAQKPEERVVKEGGRTLASYGADGLVAARVALDQDHAALFVLGVRTLLEAGSAEDHDEVLASIQRKMPAKAASSAVQALVELDPVRASPEVLVNLLRHPQTAARSAAQSALSARSNVDLLPLLEPVLRDPTADVRGRAVELITRIDDPSTLDVLLAHLDDKSPAVARRVCDALMRHASEHTDAALLALAFDDPLPMRREAHAWIALADREDHTLRAILGQRHVPQLLRALESPQPFMSGAAAVALAGIGFRSPDLEATRWLEHDVPARLVKLAAGFEYFDDFETIRPTGLRRLQQVAGVNFAGDGSAWTRWWLEYERSFRATRAVLPIDASNEDRIVVRVRAGDGSSAFTLIGPALSATPSERIGIEGEEIWLDPTQVGGLVAEMRAEGLFGFERLPGTRGTLGLGGRSLELVVDDASKSFRFGDGLGSPWFDRIVDHARALREQNRWQRFPHPSTHVDRRGLYLAEREWWETERTPGERAARREALLLGFLQAARQDQREEALIELEVLAASSDVASHDDVPKLLALLDQEAFYTTRAKRLVVLTRRAAGIDRTAPEADTVQGAVTAEQPAPPVEGSVAPTPPVAEGGALAEPLAPFADATAVELIRMLHDRFGPYAAEELASLLVARGREAVRAATGADEGLLRAVAATVLGRDTQPAEIELLRGLLEDPDDDVKIAAILALGRAKATAATVDITLLAGYAEGAVRQAALRALGTLGGEGALDVLVRALTGPDQRMKVPAAEGLAELRSAEAVPILMSLLRAGRRSDTFDAARSGIIALGSEAWNDLYAAMRAPSSELRREAALILSSQLVADSVPVLIRTLTEDAADAVVAAELAVITCVDHRTAPDPAEAWYRWWDEVDRRSPLAWFRATCEALSLRPPIAEAFANRGTRDARDFLIALIANADADWLVERARRELGRMLGVDLGPIPQGRAERALWLDTLSERLAAEAPESAVPQPGGAEVPQDAAAPGGTEAGAAAPGDGPTERAPGGDDGGR
jgi:HEAT repeat protein